MKHESGRAAISFFLNDRAVDVAVSAYESVLHLLRDRLRLTGTKESCSEGDCGSCTVAVGRMEEGRLTYRAVNSCLFPAVRLHGRHLVTVEGLARGGELHLIQRQLVEAHAIQCGYCTPGIVMSLFCLFTREAAPKKERIRQALEGNLCRCTGYESILRASLGVAGKIGEKISSWKETILPEYLGDVEGKLSGFSAPLRIDAVPGSSSEDPSRYVAPQSLAELFAVLERIGDCRKYRIINGGTDVMVDVNVKREFPECFVDIAGIRELDFIEVDDRILRIGSTVTLSRILESRAIGERLPVIPDTIRRMGSEQIRNTATLAGNVANASPVADGAVMLLGLDSRLVLRSSVGERKVSLAEFYLDFKKTVICGHEVISAVEIAVEEGFSTFEKSAKRSVVDISTVNSACFLKMDGSRVRYCRFAFGGVAKFPRTADRSGAFLKGKILTSETVRQAAEMAAGEFVPISDVRGSAGYRSVLIRNQVIRHLQRIRKNVQGWKRAGTHGKEP
jgi:xanthine dehydrogenase small subunit